MCISNRIYNEYSGRDFKRIHTSPFYVKVYKIPYVEFPVGDVVRSQRRDIDTMPDQQFCTFASAETWHKYVKTMKEYYFRIIDIPDGSIVRVKADGGSNMKTTDFIEKNKVYFVDSFWRNETVLDYFLTFNGKIMKLLPKEAEYLKTYPRCLLAVINGCKLRYIPPMYRTLEICTIAVNNSWKSFFCVPVEHRTPYMCYNAVGQSLYAYTDVPDNIKTRKFKKYCFRLHQNHPMFERIVH